MKTMIHTQPSRGFLLALVLGALLHLSLAGSTVVSADAPGVYESDPAIVAMLEGLGGNTGLVLPASKDKEAARSPRQRDYCNKMPWAADRQTALYAGGSHQTYRGNDVWEYHLGSNRWHELFAPDGGDHVFVRTTLYFGAVKTLAKDPKAVLGEKEAEGFKRTKAWWNENVILKDGHVTTRQGGPIIPAHTWDGFTYDPRAHRLLWGAGANPGGTGFYHAMVTGQDPEKVEAQIDKTYTNLWMFNPLDKTWIHYKTRAAHAPLRGMGATMQYIPDLGKSIWYVAAQNVVPHAYEMWTFDAVDDQWEELKPNGGKSLSALVNKEKVAPGSELQTAYSPAHKKLVAVLESDTFVYDILKNEWSKVNTDERINAHDARTVFAYDSVSDVFLLADPKGKTPLAAFSLKTGKWELLTPEGIAIPTRDTWGYRGFYNPVHNAFVVDGGSGKVWVYRYGVK